MKKRIMLMGALVAAQFPMSADYSQVLNSKVNYAQAINLARGKALKSSVILQERIIKLVEKHPYAVLTMLATIIGCIVYKCLVEVPVQKKYLVKTDINSQKDLLKISQIDIKEMPCNTSIHTSQQAAGAGSMDDQAQPATAQIDSMGYLHNELEWPGKNEITYFE